METVYLSPSGTIAEKEKEQKHVTGSGGVSVVREPKDLFRNWMPIDLPVTEPALPPVNMDNAPRMESQVLFGLIRDPRIRVVKPIPVEITHEGFDSVASWAEIEEFGYGNDRSEALEDFGRTVSQLFVSLSRQESQLGRDLLRVLSILRTHLTFRKIG